MSKRDRIGDALVNLFWQYNAVYRDEEGEVHIVGKPEPGPGLVIYDTQDPAADQPSGEEPKVADFSWVSGSLGSSKKGQP